MTALGLASRVCAQPPPTKVVAAQAVVHEAPPTLDLIGTLRPLRRSRVASEVAGLVMEAPAREGDHVRAGQVLCVLNADVATLRLKEGEARLAGLKAAHEELRAGTREEELRRLRALLGEAQARVERWRFEKERVDKLYSGSEAGSVREVYDAIAEHEMARQRQLAAAAAYDEAVKGPRPETIARAAQEVAQQQSVVDRLAQDLEKLTLKAPFAGTIVQRNVEVGEWLDGGDEAAELVDLESVLVRVDVPERAVGQVHEGESALVLVDALGQRLEGRVRHVIPQVHEQARTFPVEIEVTNREGRLAAGMFSRVTLSCGAPVESVCVPKDAVLMRDGVNYVAVVAPGEQGALMGIPKPVTTGASAGDLIAITSGNIEAGERVIVRGNERVFMPMPVALVDAHGTPVKSESPAPAPPGDSSALGTSGAQRGETGPPPKGEKKE